MPCLGITHFVKNKKKKPPKKHYYQTTLLKKMILFVEKYRLANSKMMLLGNWSEIINYDQKRP